jgi:hypothetical protein
MGLLGNDWEDPQSQAIMALAGGLLQGNFGKGASDYGAVLAGAKDQAMKRKMLDMQMQQHQLALEKARQEAADEQAMQAAGRSSYTSPEAATAQSMGPMPNGSAMPNVVPGFDQKAFLSKMYGISPLKAMALEQSMTKETPINKLDVKDFTPASVAKFAMTKNYADLERMDKLHFQDAGGKVSAMNPFTGAEVSSTRKTGNPFSDLIVANEAGGMVPNSPLLAAKTAIARAGASSNTVNIAGPENKYNQVISEGLGKSDLETVDVAKNAPEVVRNARVIRQALAKGAITGTGAEARLAVQKALETAGLVGPGKAESTQALIASLSTTTLGAIKTSGLGSGQGFTDKDRQFLSDAKSGTIDSTPGNLLRIADLSERAAKSSYQKGTKILDQWNENPALKNVVKINTLDPIPEDQPKQNLMSKMPPAQANKGKMVRDTETGKMLKSNGLSWVEVK